MWHSTYTEKTCFRLWAGRRRGLSCTHNNIWISRWVQNNTTLITIISLYMQVKSAMARGLPVENLLPQNVGSNTIYLQ